ncbi:MAG: AAA family ATPase [Candidatus Dependentiae bacterium]|nr:AAA family ATPase [Candidatus Dependentiae bacterium]
MKKLPIGIQTFAKLIEQDCVYVDKTEQIYHLITTGSYYFLSRPRRFGKSLLISTLKEIFLGNQKLFKNLWIGKTNQKFAWDNHVVIHIDFSSLPHATPQELRDSLIRRMANIAQEHGLPTLAKESPEEALQDLVTQLAQHSKVVMLVDEYDYPILTHLHEKVTAKAQQAILKSFYTTIKSLDAYLQFVFLTGITKFSKTSIFSGLNNLKDISNTPQGASLLGYTDDEIVLFFEPHITAIAQEQQIPFADIVQQIKIWYDGYRFSSKNILVYNPFSVLLYLDSGIFENYWFETGTPSFLVAMLRDKYKSIENIATGKIGVSSLGTFNIESIPLVTLLFQTGYLTIKAFDVNSRKYRLGFPNKEVAISFEKHLMSIFTYHEETDVDNYIFNMRDALDGNDLETFFDYLKTLFANIPYHLHIKQEKYYHSLFQFMGNLLGLDVQSEVATDKGRIDVTIITKKYIHIFEFKFNASAKVALEQIEQKKYYEKYRNKNKKIIMVGVSFNRTDDDLELEYITKNVILK